MIFWWLLWIKVHVFQGLSRLIQSFEEDLAAFLSFFWPFWTKLNWQNEKNYKINLFHVVFDEIFSFFVQVLCLFYFSFLDSLFSLGLVLVREADLCFFILQAEEVKHFLVLYLREKALGLFIGFILWRWLILRRGFFQFPFLLQLGQLHFWYFTFWEGLKFFLLLLLLIRLFWVTFLHL